MRERKMAKWRSCVPSDWLLAWPFRSWATCLAGPQPPNNLGNTAGKDTASEKATYPALFGIEASEHKADALVNEAFAELDSFGELAETLKELARFLVERKK